MSGALANLASGPLASVQAELPAASTRIMVTSTLARRLVWLFIALLALSSTVIQITGAVIAHGYVGVRNDTRQVMHPTGGIISEVLVVEGQRVRKGQLLARLSTDVSGVTAAVAEQSVEKSLARQARLRAERDGLGSIAFPPELLAMQTPSAIGAMRDEAQLFNLRRLERQNLRYQLGQRKRQAEQQISSYGSQIETLKKQKDLIQPELNGLRDLWKRGLVTINRLNQLERAAIDVDGSISALNAQIAQVRAHSAELGEQLVSVDQSARSQAGLDLAEVEAALKDDLMRNASASDQLKRSEIRAPFDGVVEKLRITKAGELLASAQPLLDIVPTGQSDVVEVRVEPSDVARLRLGAKARVVFPAANAAATPDAEGTVSYIAAERTTDAQTGVTFFTAQVRLTGHAMGGRLALRSGIPADVYVKTEQKSLMSYILKPVSDQISRAFKYM